MLVNLDVVTLSQEKIDLYQKRLNDAFGEKCDTIVTPDFFHVSNLTSKNTNRKDNTGLYPSRITFSNDKLTDKTIKIEKFPCFLPVIISEIKENDDDEYVEMSQRLHGYGICRSIPDFLEMTMAQLQKSKRKFYVYFSKHKASDNIWEKNGSFIAKDHSISINDEDNVYLYHVCEVLKKDEKTLTSDQKLTLMGKDLRGEEFDTENLLNNFK